MKSAIAIAILCIGSVTGAYPACHQLEGSRDPSMFGAINLDGLGKSYRLVIFGEWHGTNEVPDMMFDIICNVAMRYASANRPIIFALEYPMAESGHLQQFLYSKGRQKDIKAFLATPFWKREMQDGRTSLAMFRLLENIRRFGKEASQLKVIPYVPEWNIEKATVDESYAREINKILSLNPNAIVLVLTGNYHAIRASMSQTMASLIKHSDFSSYAFSSRGGTAWVCYSPDACGETVIKGTVTANASTPLTEESEKRYDGLIDIGRITASSPAYFSIESE